MSTAEQTTQVEVEIVDASFSKHDLAVRLANLEARNRQLERELDKARTSLIVSPQTGKPYNPAAGFITKLTAKQELAIRMLACGQVANEKAAAAVAKCSTQRFSQILNSHLGQQVVARVRGELDFRYQNLYNKFIDVVELAMDHADPSVALAGASLFAKTQLGTKHTTKIELSAEDVVSQIINGDYEVVG